MVALAATPSDRAPDDKPAKAVVNGELTYTSVSQVQKFDRETHGGCERAWFFDKVQGLPEPETKAQAAGKLMHEQIEHYLKTGEMVLGPLALAGRRFIPEPRTIKPGLFVEEKFDHAGRELVTAGGVPFVGYIDVRNTRGEYIDPLGNLQRETEPSKTVEVLDWKSTSDVGKHAKSVKGLIDSIQMNGYSKFAWNKNAEVEHFRISHAYFQTRGFAETKKVTTVIDREAVSRGWARIERTVARMQQVARETDPAKVEANLASCDAWGRGCAFKHVCPRPLGALLRTGKAPSGGQTMSLMSRIKSNAAPAPQAAPTPPVAAAPAAAPPPESRAEIIARLQRAEAEAQTAAAAPAPAAPSHKGSLDPREVKTEPTGAVTLYGAAAVAFADCAPGAAVQTSMAELIKAGLTVAPTPGQATIKATHPSTSLMGVTPPDAPPSDPAGRAEPVAPETMMTLPEDVRESAEEHAEHAEAAAQAAAMSGSTSDAKILGMPALDAVNPKSDATLPSPKRGRPTKAEVAERAAAAQRVEHSTPAANVTPDVAVPAHYVQRLTPGLAANPFGGLVILADAVFDLPGSVRGTESNLDSYIRDICQQLARANDAADIRCAPNDSALAFAKWKGALTVAVRETPPDPGIYRVDFVANDEIKQIVVDALRPLCTLWVRGQ